MSDRVATRRKIDVGSVLIVIGAPLILIARRLVAIGPRLVPITDVWSRSDGV